MFPLILCSHWSCVPTDPMFPLILCSHWSYVPTDPMFPLILCSHWSYVPIDPVFPLILCSHWSYVPTDPVFPLILCSHGSYIPTNPTNPLILCYIAPTNPLILLSFLTYEVIGSIIPPNSDHIVYDVAGAAHTLYQPHVRCKCKYKCKDLHVWAGATQAQMQTQGENTGSIGSLPPRHSSKEDGADVVRNFGRKTFGEWKEISSISRQKFTKLKEETKETPPWKEVAR